MTSHGFSPIEKLAPTHDTAEFDCGQEALNRFLHRFALANQRAHSAQTYVTCQAGKVMGFYSLAVGSVRPEDAPPRVTRGLPRHPVPIMILARLAVDRLCQGQGLGRGLLKDALLRTLQAADLAGIRAIVVHAKDDAARTWYGQFEFDPSPTDPYHLFLVMKELKRLVQGDGP